MLAISNIISRGTDQRKVLFQENCVGGAVSPHHASFDNVCVSAVPAVGNV